MASVSFNDVAKAFGSTKVIHGISFDIADGEFMVLVGPSGCGKSTLLRMLAGLEEINAGTIAIDGKVEQIGSPLELYDRPNNLFVAQFIGSPAMNIIGGTLHRNGDGSFVHADGDVRWPLARDGGVHGQPVVYGIRPEHLSLAGENAPVQAEVIVVEPTGAETELLVKAGNAQIVMVMHGRTRVKPGDRVGLAVEPGAVHLFDQSTKDSLRATL